jgi:hypothetical protein
MLDSKKQVEIHDSGSLLRKWSDSWFLQKGSLLGYYTKMRTSSKLSRPVTLLLLLAGAGSVHPYWNRLVRVLLGVAKILVDWHSYRFAEVSSIQAAVDII